eukprot:6102547-Prymnesium_polylepis.1
MPPLECHSSRLRFAASVHRSPHGTDRPSRRNGLIGRRIAQLSPRDPRLRPPGPLGPTRPRRGHDAIGVQVGGWIGEGAAAHDKDVRGLHVRPRHQRIAIEVHGDAACS